MMTMVVKLNSKDGYNTKAIGTKHKKTPTWWKPSIRIALTLLLLLGQNNPEDLIYKTVLVEQEG